MMGGQQFSLSVYGTDVFRVDVCRARWVDASQSGKSRPVLHTSLVHSTRVHFNML